MFKNSETRQSKLYAGLAGVAALALFTACTAEDSPQEEPADQQVESQQESASEGEAAETDDTATEESDETADTTDGSDEAAGSNDEVYSIIEAVEAEYSGGIIVDIDLEDNGSIYEVEVVVDNEVYELDVSSDGSINVDDRDNDEDEDIREAQDANVTVTEALDDAFSQYSDASFDQIQLEEDDGQLYWEIDLDDANGSEIELEVSAS
ncbi:hypothetical protein GCM10009720_16910 [Yaniella flava]|uniref:PepSY domain-containing protein n=1 Tax=Yaniella flava TaxID=287930 RepID=A0ABN2UG80_9MICC